MSLSAMTLVGQQLQDLNSIKTHTSNIANANVPGFQQYIPRVEAKSMDLGGSNKFNYVEDQGLWRMTSPGGLQYTGESLHAALNTPGYFTLQGNLFSRNGAFHRDAENRLVNAENIPVLDDGGAEITLPSEGRIEIAGDGTITADKQSVAKLGIVTFKPEDEQKMQPMGSGYLTRAAATPAEKVDLSGGFLETANGDPIMVMSLMIQASQSYAEKQKMINDIRESEKNMQQQMASAA